MSSRAGSKRVLLTIFIFVLFRYISGNESWLALILSYSLRKTFAARSKDAVQVMYHHLVTLSVSIYNQLSQLLLLLLNIKGPLYLRKVFLSALSW